MLSYLFDISNAPIYYGLAVGATFLITFFALKFFMRFLPKDQGRQFAVNGALSEGKPRGAGLVFITSFVLCSALFIPMTVERIINLVLIYAAMMTGYLDDEAKKPWGELKKGLLDAVISIGIAINFVYFNSTTIKLLGTSFDLPKVAYVILGAILVWASINVTNCSDGVDGLCGSLSIATIFLFNLLGSSYHLFNIIMIATLFAYLWFNASPSKLLMGDAGSRAIGVFIAIIAMQSRHPLMFIPLALILIIDGGLGLIKLTIRRVLKAKNFMENIRTPIHDHARKNKGWSDTQVVMRFVILQLIIGLVSVYILSQF